MNEMRIYSESPDKEQWKMLLHFAYHRNIERYLDSKGITASKPLIEAISGSILQAQEYFSAFYHSSLQISPLLLYYGATNLLYGLYCLQEGTSPLISDHGMRVSKETISEKGRLADIHIVPNNPLKGALSVFCRNLTSECSLSNFGSWSVQELISSLPELFDDFILGYPDGKPHVIPVEIVTTSKDIRVERINPRHLQRIGSFDDVFSKISGFGAAYLSPQYSEQMSHVLLRPKLGGQDIGIYSLSGQKFLIVSHLKLGKQIAPPEEIIMYMALFSLGYLSRYHPEVWNPFVRNDTSGEKLIAEKILDVVGRKLPNLVLNRILGKQVLFSRDTQGHLDYSTFVTHDEVLETVREEYRKISSQERMRNS